MASIINASSSGSGGIVQTADASGVLQLQSNGTVAVNILSGTSIAVGSATAYNGGGFGSNMSIYGSTAAAITVVNATEQFQMGANSANNLGFYNPTHGTYMAAMNQYGIGVGDAVPSSGFGIAFPATQSPSSNANTLDDYEEGTFTPGLMFGSGGTTGIVYGAQNGIYIKIGRMVWVRCGWILSSKGSSTGTAYVTNLPFTSQSQSYSDPSVLFTGAAWTSLSGTLQGVIENNQTYIRLVTNTSTGYVSLTNSNVNGTSELYAQFCYCTAN